MIIRRNVALAGAIAAVGITSLTGLGVATAQSNSGNDSLVEKIASKFNLNKDEVQGVFDEFHQEKQAEHQAEISERLQTAVDDGKLTAEQKTLIENKLKEVQTKREEERKALVQWASQNNIDVKYVFGGRHSDDRLQQAVDNGDITSEQKKLIEAKRQELKDARDTLRDELEQWSEDNDIDQKYLMFAGHGGPGGRGPHGMTEM